MITAYFIRRFSISALIIICLVCMGTEARAQLLYRVEGDGLSQPSYIFGTHHLAPLSTLDSVVGLRESFETSDAVVGEIDMTVNQLQLATVMRPYMEAPADSTLSKLLSDTDYNFVDEKLKSAAGLHLEMFETMRPMVLMTLVSAMIVASEMDNHNTGEQLDTYFQIQGVKEGKIIVALESAEEQAQILYGSQSLISQAQDLVNMMSDLEKLVDDARLMNRAYASQNLEELYEVGMSEENDPDFMERLLESRNEKWVAELPAIFEDHGSCFVAVGALHLPGERGILEMLRRQGYNVTEVKN